MSNSTESRLARETGITTVDDATLIHAYLRLDDAASLSELIRRHQIPVYRLLTALLPDPERAEPACEEVFVRAARRLEEIDAGVSVATWLADVARDVASEQDEAPEPLPRAIAVDETIAAGGGRAAMRGAVRRALDKLEPTMRSVLLLAELHGEPLDRVAATLGLPPSEVRGLLERARTRFAEAFATPAESAADQGIGRGETAAAASVAATPAAAATGPRTVACEGYEVLEQLGEGGMGVVYRARHLATDSPRALKVLQSEYVSSSVTLARFRREAAIGLPLRHPNVVEVYELGQSREGDPFIAMELLQGEALGDRLDRDGRLDIAVALQVMRQLLMALAYLHQRDIVHRDIKSDNVMLVERGEAGAHAKLLDLGIARVPESEPATRLTAAGMTLGTPAYIAPEQALGAAVDGRADLYSASVLLFEMLTGRLPFESDDAGALLAKHVSQPPPRLRHRGLKASRGLEVAVARGLSKQPYDRYDDAGEYLQTLAALDEAS